ncbi:hypothetical protein [Puniceibacterium sediminis]|uniref:Invasion protein IalB, involved in pathogenesis n=1 Tax=Puniceibacterium sediminis TaxID=1608407 RepID=A0A238X858_9RHOB|nr:hypothetical protein [Puniceibacterium sediminis]SNR54524.1 hypothetical protein SAMN06265370_109122 [Puniceibacterium sediminis]
MKLIIGSLFALIAGPAWADGYWEYGSWRVDVQEVDTGEDLRRTCSAVTGGDGSPSVQVSMSNGDAGPPDYFPTVLISEHAPRGHGTVLQDGQAAYIRFDNEESMDGAVSGFFDEEGFANAEIAFDHPLSQWVLRAMRLNGQFDVVVEGNVFMYVYLDGFTASYLKMAEECGFSGAGVID